MIAMSSSITEADILTEVVAPDRPGLPPELARSILQLGFNKEAAKRIRALLRKNSRAAISPEERLLLDKYLRVGQFLDLLQAKARLSLQQNPAND